MTIQLALFDLDDTLAAINQQVEESVVRALREMEAGGMMIGLVSGKPALYLSGIARQIGLANPVLAGENGAVIYFSASIPPRQMLAVDGNEEERCLLDEFRGLVREKFPDAWQQPNLVNVTLFPEDRAKLPQMGQFFQEWVDDKGVAGLFSVYVHADAVEIIPKRTDKGAALLRIAATLEISPQHVAAVGDGENDLPMFREAGVSIGIGRNGATHRVATIAEALELIRSISAGKFRGGAVNLEDLRRNDKSLWHLEYEQVAHDWRHRDAMLWQSVAVSVAITGAVFSMVFNKDIDLATPLFSCSADHAFCIHVTRQFAVLMFAGLFNFLMLVKIVKDHYYQRGSSELLRRLGMPVENERVSLRIYRPFNEAGRSIPFKPVYGMLTKMPAFRLFFFFQLTLTVFILFLLAAGSDPDRNPAKNGKRVQTSSLSTGNEMPLQTGITPTFPTETGGTPQLNQHVSRPTEPQP